MGEPTRIPVHVLTGFLGSGKTSLLNNLVHSDWMADAAVIINEFGEAGLDHHLVEGSDDTVIELSNGCLCCTVRGQLVETLERLAERAPSRIVIETTGLADPVPVLQAVIASPNLKDRISLTEMLCVFDVLHGGQTLAEHREAREQIALADRIILTKLDCVDPSKRSALAEATKRRLSDLNPVAGIISREAFLHELADRAPPPEPSRATGIVQQSHNPEGGHDHGHEHGHEHGHDHGHDPNRHSERIRTVTLRHSSPVERAKLEMFLDLLLSAHGDHVLRLKGLVAVEGERRPMVVQAVQRTLSPPSYLKEWPQGMAPASTLTVFLRDMQPDFVRRLFNGFMNIPSPDTPDRAAITANPLAIPGAGAFRPD